MSNLSRQDAKAGIPLLQCYEVGQILQANVQCRFSSRPLQRKNGNCGITGRKEFLYRLRYQDSAACRRFSIVQKSRRTAAAPDITNPLYPSMGSLHGSKKSF